MSFNGLLLQKETKKSLENFLQDVSGGAILFGDKGIGKSLCARRIACSILNCNEKELDIHPDFYCVEPIKDVIKIEQIHSLRSRCGMVATMGEKKVYIIIDADKMSYSAQNAILKVLEDGNKTNIILFVTQNMLLHTIHSRCTMIRFKNPTKEQLTLYEGLKGNQIDPIANSISDGRIGFYQQLKQEGEYLDTIQRIINTFNTMNMKRELTEAFHVLKEKDKDSFMEKYEMEYVISFMKLLRDIFTDLIMVKYGKEPGFDFINYENLIGQYSLIRMMTVAESLDRDLLRTKIKGGYNKNDFFNLVKILVA